MKTQWVVREKYQLLNTNKNKEEKVMTKTKENKIKIEVISQIEDDLLNMASKTTGGIDDLALDKYTNNLGNWQEQLIYENLELEENQGGK